MIYAWDNYPEPQFPALWEWIAAQFIADAFVIPEIAFVEVGHKSPECVDWLKNNGVKTVDVNNAILQEALRIKGLLGIVDDRDYAGGVDENDLIIIATAKIKKFALVSEEGRQANLPKKPANQKIPAVCKLTTVDVPCSNFVELIKQSKVVFR